MGQLAVWKSLILNLPPSSTIIVIILLLKSGNRTIYKKNIFGFVDLIKNEKSDIPESSISLRISNNISFYYQKRNGSGLLPPVPIDPSRKQEKRTKLSI